MTNSTKSEACADRDPERAVEFRILEQLERERRAPA